jgi:hypothetical protein
MSCSSNLRKLTSFLLTFFVLCGGAVASAQSISVPTSFNSGKVGVGQSATRSLTVANTGSQTLSGTILSPTGPFTTTATGPFSVPAGQSLVVPITFSPTAAGAASGSLPFISNANNSPPPSVALTGVGLPGKPTVAHSIALPPIKKNSSTATTRTKTLKNTGKGVLVGTIGASQPPFTVTSGSGPYMLDPRKSTTFTTTFAPAAAGKYRGALPFTSSNPKKQSFSSGLHGVAKNAVTQLPPPPPPGPPIPSGCNLPPVVIPNGGGKPPIDTSTAEALLNTLTAAAQNPAGALPDLSQLTGTLPSGVPDVASLPVVGTISGIPGGGLSGLPLTVPSSPPDLGSLVPTSPETIPVLGSMPTGSDTVCQAVNGVIVLTGACGQALGVIVTEGSAALSPSDLTTIGTELADLANQLQSANGIQELANNPSQLAGFLQNPMPQLTSLQSFATDVQDGLTKCANSLPSLGGGTPPPPTTLPPLALPDPNTLVPALGQLTGSLPDGNSLSDVPVLGAIVTGGTPSFLPSPNSIPTLGTLTSGVLNAATLLNSVPVIGSLPTGGASDQLQGVVTVIDGTSKKLLALVAVLGPVGSAPSPSDLQALITSLGDGTTFKNLPQVVTIVETVLATPVPGLGSDILSNQIAQTAGLDTLSSTALTNLEATITGLPGLLL